ncbi:MAG TPA: AMP-binding protein [Candidatus Acidoferrales bacterium]|nr:AMP-binding protein [Candidatus Acidoferrales bacterium]
MSEAFQAARDFLLGHRQDYHAAYAGFRWPQLERFNWALEWFDRIAAGERGDQTALWLVSEEGAETKLSFRQLSRRSSQVANHLRGLGVRRGDRVLLMLGNVAPLWETMLAAIKLGAVVVPSTTLLTVADVADRVARGGVRHIVAAAESAATIGDAGASCTRIAVGGPVAGWRDYGEAAGAAADFAPEGETAAGDPVQLYFTSGTTKRPKLVLHSHASYPAGHLSTMYWLGLRPGDIHCNLSSPGWAKHAWSCFFAPWNAEATVFVLQQRRFHAARLLDAVARYRITSFCAPPTVWRTLVRENLAGWKTQLCELASAGEPLNPEVIEQVRVAWGLTIRDGYGQTETTALVGNPPGQPLKLGSMGRPLPGYRTAILDAEGREAKEGELCLRLSPAPLGLMPSCQREDAACGPVYRTGDVVSSDEDGYLTFIGRADDVFKASDYRISPFELESALIEHGAVVECAVVPAPDPIRTAVPKAFIVLRAGVEPTRETALSIFRHIRQALAPYKRVRRIEFGELPKTISGKIRRIELRRAEADRTKSGFHPQNEFREEDFPELR